MSLGCVRDGSHAGTERTPHINLLGVMWQSYTLHKCASWKYKSKILDIFHFLSDNGIRKSTTGPPRSVKIPSKTVMNPLVTITQESLVKQGEKWGSSKSWPSPQGHGCLHMILCLLSLIYTLELPKYGYKFLSNIWFLFNIMDPKWCLLCGAQSAKKINK